MGIVLFLIFAVLEIALAVRSRGKLKKDPIRLRDRLIVRVAEFAAALIALLLPFGQKWRLIPALILLGVLLLIALIRFLRNRGKEASGKKVSAAAPVWNLLLLAFLLIPAFVFTGYKGLPVSGSHRVAQTSAIVIDASRTDPFEQDGSAREVPVHFYYPADAAEGERFPLVVFSHGAFGYYESNTSTYLELASNGYVVAALDHPHHAFFTQDSAGQTVLVDMDFMQTATSYCFSSRWPVRLPCRDLTKASISRTSSVRRRQRIRTSSRSWGPICLISTSIRPWGAGGGGPGHAWYQ